MRFKLPAGLLVVVVLIGSIMVGSSVFAQEYTSPNYKVDELFIGAGGTNDASSSNLRGRASIGDLINGRSASSSFQAFGGFTTTQTPELELTIDTSDVDLGVLSTASTAFGSMKFTVRTYLASGYIVTTIGAPPTNEGGNQIDPLTGGGSPTPGTEQFGINLIDNSSPDVGADPLQIPDNSFSFGTVATGYGTLNNFRYNNFDTIAQSTSSSGKTQYTISYIFNINSTTAAGLYTFRQTVVATSTF